MNDNSTYKIITGANLRVLVPRERQGYIRASILSPAPSSAYKLRISKEDVTYTYDIGNPNMYDTYPLQMGNGDYMVRLYRCLGGKKYALDGGIWLKIDGIGECEPYICPNQYVPYGSCRNAAGIRNTASTLISYDAVRTIANTKAYMESGYCYDYIRAILVRNGNLPDIDRCYEKAMGICIDLAALTVALLRINGIPARMVIGYVGKQYHAWVEIWRGEWEMYDPTACISGKRKSGQYRAERYY